jgi:hypothetical protein
MKPEDERKMYWFCKRRRNETLVRWWDQLNGWKWPKEIPSPESRDVQENPRRRMVMRVIVAELGHRMIRCVREQRICQ